MYFRSKCVSFCNPTAVSSISTAIPETKRTPLSVFLVCSTFGLFIDKALRLHFLSKYLVKSALPLRAESLTQLSHKSALCKDK